MIQAFLGGALSGAIVAFTGWAIVMLHRLFPDPPPYDWPVWVHRAVLSLRAHGVHSWR